MLSMGHQHRAQDTVEPVPHKVILVEIHHKVVLEVVNLKVDLVVDHPRELLELAHLKEALALSNKKLKETLILRIRSMAFPSRTKILLEDQEVKPLRALETGLVAVGERRQVTDLQISNLV